MRNRERFLRQSRMALCAAGLIGLGVTSANASLDFKFDVQSLKLSSGDTATNVAGQGYNQVLIAPGSIVGLQLNAVVNAAPGGVTLGQQRGFWSTNGDFLSNDAGPGLDLSAAGASIIVNLNSVTIPAIDPFNKSGATAGIPVAGDLTDVWMRKSPVTATSLGSSSEVPTAPNASDAASATWYVAKLNVTGQAGTGTSVVSYKPEAVDGVLFVDNTGIQTTGGTPATVEVSSDAANITGKAVAKVGAAGLTTPSIGVAGGASLTLIGGGPVTTDAFSMIGVGSGFEIGTSAVRVVGGNLAAIEALTKAGQISSSAVTASPLLYGLGVATVNGTDVLISRTLLGDADVSGIVDFGDFNIWLANAGSETGTWATADFDRTGIVDFGDFNVWLANAGGEIPIESLSGLSPEAIGFLAAHGVAVPEPASFGLLAVGALGLLARRRNR